MLVHNINIFARESFTPKFESLSGGKDILLRLYSGNTISSSPTITVFFANPQEAINFKNAIIQSWETHLKEEAKKKS